MQQQIQNLITTAFDGFYPKVIISYATEQRPGPTGDAEGAGPGMLIAAEVITAFFKEDIPCFSGLMTQAGNNWHEFLLRIAHPNARFLIVLLSKAFFRSTACLKEVHKAIEKGLVIIPVRVEEPERRASIDIARDTESLWPDATIERYARSEWRNETVYLTTLKEIQLQRFAVRDKLGNLNTLPERGSLFGYSTGLQDLVSRVRGIAYPQS